MIVNSRCGFWDRNLRRLISAIAQAVRLAAAILILGLNKA